MIEFIAPTEIDMPVMGNLTAQLKAQVQTMAQQIGSQAATSSPDAHAQQILSQLKLSTGKVSDQLQTATTYLTVESVLKELRALTEVATQLKIKLERGAVAAPPSGLIGKAAAGAAQAAQQAATKQGDAISQAELAKLQQAMERTSKMMDTLSSVQKQMSDMNKSIMQNAGR
jgi:hypothetical protein